MLAGTRSARPGWPARRRSGSSRRTPSSPRGTPTCGPGTTSQPTSGALFARMQEVYAGFVDHTDAQIGRLVAYLEALGAAGRHADRPDLGQRRQPGGRPGRSGQRSQAPPVRARDAGAEPVGHRPPRRRDDVRPLSDRVGRRPQHAAQVVQEGRPRGRGPRPADRPLAQRDRRAEAACATSSTTSWTSTPTVLDLLGIEAPDDPSRRGPVADPRHQPGLHVRRGGRARPASGPSTSSCWATGGSGTTAGRSSSRHEKGDRLRAGPLGAVPPGPGFLGVPRPGGRAAGEAARDGPALVDRGRPLRRRCPLDDREYERIAASMAARARRRYVFTPAWPASTGSARRTSRTARTRSRPRSRAEGRRRGRAARIGGPIRRLRPLRQGRAPGLRLSSLAPGTGS